MHGMKLYYIYFHCILSSTFLSFPLVDNESEFADSKDRGFDNGKYIINLFYVFVFILFCIFVYVLWSATYCKIDVLTPQGDWQIS